MCTNTTLITSELIVYNEDISNYRMKSMQVTKLAPTRDVNEE